MASGADTSLKPAAAAIGLSLAVIAVVAGLAVFSPTAKATAVLFADDQGLAAVASAGGQILDVRLGGRLVLAMAETATFRDDVARHGAIVALPFAAPAGCTSTLIPNNKDDLKP
jgi:hypothetical protein